MLRRSVLILGYALIFAAALIGVVDGTGWIANGTMVFTPVSAALQFVGIQLTEGEWLKWPALVTTLMTGLFLAIGAIVALGDKRDVSIDQL